MALIGAGIGMFISMVGDCIDGLHARRTNQTSKLGELMDHWLDAIIVPLVTVGITSALQMDRGPMPRSTSRQRWSTTRSSCSITTRASSWSPEPATGVEAQFGVSLGYVAMAGFFYYVDRHQPWLDIAFGVLAVAGVVVQLRCNYFYYTQLGRFIVEHLWFVGAVQRLRRALSPGHHRAPCLPVHGRVHVVPHLRNVRANTITKARFNGHDLGLLAFIVVIFAVHYGRASGARPGAGAFDRRERLDTRSLCIRDRSQLHRLREALPDAASAGGSCDQGELAHSRPIHELP